MVARDGVEPPTPAFSDLVQPEPTNYLQVCGRLPSTCKYVEGTAILGWDPGLSFVAILLPSTFGTGNHQPWRRLRGLPVVVRKRNPFHTLQVHRGRPGGSPL